MNGKLDKKQARQVLEDLKGEVPGLIIAVQKAKNWSMWELADYLNKELIEKVPKFKIKSKSAFDKWTQKKRDSDDFKGAPNNKEVKIVVDALKELLKPPIQDPTLYIETIRSSVEQLFVPGFIPTIPPDLIDFWEKPYNYTFKLYNWPNIFSIIELADRKNELKTLNDFFAQHIGTNSQISKLLPFAKENKGGQGFYLSYGFNKEDKDFGVYLWDINGLYHEYPIFIANSITDLLGDHVITLENEKHLHFDNEKYLNEIFEKNMKGYILSINFNDGNEPKTNDKTLTEFYDSAFRMYNRGTIKIEASKKLITVSIKNEDSKSTAYNIKDGDLFPFIEKLNDDLNGRDKSNFGRPKYYGYYLINKKYLAYCRLDIATDLIQKGYINSQYKILSMLTFCSPELALHIPKISIIFNEIRTLADTEKLEKINWINKDPQPK